MPPERPGRHALLIGIDRYPKLKAGAQLEGCVNDVRLMAEVLESSFGFPPEGIVRLENAAASRRRILAALGRLRRRVAPGDRVVVHYSGHGSRMRDREGDEPDGWDETLVPADSGRSPHPNRDVTDDELYLWLLEITAVTPYVTLLFDSCFSGGIARDPFAAPVRWLPPDPRPPRELPPSPVTSPAARGELAGSNRELGPSGWLPVSDRYTLVAACRETESAFELELGDGGSTHHGALTHFLCRELLAGEAGATYRDLFERTAARVTAAYPNQHPQLEGARDRELFGARQLPPMPFLPVRERTGASVILGGGAAHGLTVGSQWAIYPQGTRRVTAEVPRQGTVEVSAVRAVSADAVVVEEAEPELIQPAGRAVEEAHRFGEMRLTVEVWPAGAPEPRRAELEAGLRASRLLRPAREREAGEVRVYALPPRAGAGPEEPVPQLGALAEATWAAVGRDGQLLAPLVPVAAPGALTRMLDNLEARARYRFLLELENPDRSSPLRGQVELTLLRRRGDGSWAEAEPGESGEVRFDEGERLAVAVTHHHTAPLYLHLLDFGLTGRVALLYPAPGANEPLAPERTLEIGTRRGEELELYLPEGFPFLPVPAAAPAGGSEYLKLLATTHEADLTPLLQDGYRHAGGNLPAAGGGSLEQLLALAFTGRGSRDARPIHQDEDWTSVIRAFHLRRPG